MVTYYSAPGRGAEYCDRLVCLSVCLSDCRQHISEIVGPIGTKFCVQIPCVAVDRYSWRRCATICTSGFMNDVTFGHNGSHGDSGVAIPGRNLMSMNALFFSYNACNTILSTRPLTEGEQIAEVKRLLNFVIY